MPDPGDVFRISLSEFTGNDPSKPVADLSRKEEGDIISIRKLSRQVNGAARKSQKRFMYLFVYAPSIPLEELTEPVFGLYKRRYNIPFEKLKEIMPEFDLVKARDLSESYQPFLGLDDENRAASPKAPLIIDGIIYDKLLGRFV